MTTLNDLVDAVIGEVMGESATIDVMSYLMTSIDDNDVLLTVADGSQFSRGLIEIGEELILVETVNRSDGTLTCAPSGRGVRGTKATAHAAGDIVTMNPTVPRSRAVRAVREALRADSGLFAVGSTEVTFNPMQGSYPVPAEVSDILQVTWEPGITVDEHPVPVRRWTFDRHSMRLIIGDSIRPGAKVRVSYSTSPLLPASLDDDFTTTGLPESCIDVIRFGAAWRVVSFMEPHNLLAQSAEAQAMNRNAQPGQRLTVARYFYQMYTERLTSEVASLQNRYPIRVHHQGRW